MNSIDLSTGARYVVSTTHALIFWAALQIYATTAAIRIVLLRAKMARKEKEVKRSRLLIMIKILSLITY